MLTRNYRKLRVIKLKSLFPIFLFSALFLLNSCSSRNLIKNSYSTPEPHPAPKALAESERVVALATINDLNAQLSGIESQGIRIGGLKLTKDYLSILKKSYAENLLTLSTGHLIPHLANDDLAKSVLTQVESLPIDFFGVSYREIDFLTSKAVTSESFKQHFLNSNIFKIQTSQLIEDTPLLPFAVKKINDVSFGLISVAPANDKKINNGVYFQDPVPAILKTRNQLLKQDVDVIVLLSHFPSLCETKEPSDANKNELICQDDQGLSLLIKRLPPQTVDIIVSTGERFSYGLHSSGIYILNTPGNGLYLGHLQLVFDTETKKINHQKTSVFVPTLLCENFFELTQDCYVGENEKRIEALKKSQFEKVQAIFFGEELIP